MLDLRYLCMCSSRTADSSVAKLNGKPREERHAFDIDGYPDCQLPFVQAVGLSGVPVDLDWGNFPVCGVHIGMYLAAGWHARDFTPEELQQLEDAGLDGVSGRVLELLGRKETDVA